MNFTFTLGTFLMALAGFAIHFLMSWHEFYRAKDTPHILPIAYITLDLPAWIASFLGAAIGYFALPELGEVLGSSVPIGLTPFWSAVIGYVGASMGPKLLGMAASRAGVR